MFAVEATFAKTLFRKVMSRMSCPFASKFPIWALQSVAKFPSTRMSVHTSPFTPKVWKRSVWFSPTLSMWLK